MNKLSQDKLLKIATDELKNVKKGSIFLTKDLFVGHKWKELDRGKRITLGSMFLNYIHYNSDSNVKILDKTSSNEQKYKKQ